DALSAWLDIPVAPPTLEFECMLRVLFADQGDLSQLRAALATTIRQATESRARFAEMAADMLDSGGAFPERVHVNTLGMQFMVDHYDHIIAWAEWALDAIKSWKDTTSSAGTWAAPARAILEEAAYGRA